MGAFECPAVGSSVFSSPLVELITCGEASVSAGHPAGHRLVLSLVPGPVAAPGGGTAPRPPPALPCPARARSTSVPTWGKRTVPSPSQHCSALVLSTADCNDPEFPAHPHRTGVAGGPMTLLAAPHHPSAKPSTQTQLLSLDPKPWHCWALWGRAQCPSHRLLPAPRAPARSQAAGPRGKPGHRGRDGVGTGNGDLPENPSAAPAKPGVPWWMRRHRQAACPMRTFGPSLAQQPPCPASGAPSSDSPLKPARGPVSHQHPLQRRARAELGGRPAEQEQGAAAGAGRGRWRSGAG